MSKRQMTACALFLMIVVSLIMIISGSLDGAAAWANIIALPVAIAGVILTIRGASGSTSSSGARDQVSLSGPAKPGRDSPIVNQVGFSSGRQANVAGDYFERGHDDREGR